MRIEFEGITNSKDVYINTATFRLPSGREVTVDRDRTEWSVSDAGILRMEWKNCYIWDEEEARYEFPKEFDDAEFVSIEVEDDAPEGYEVEIQMASWIVA